MQISISFGDSSPQVDQTIGYELPLLNKKNIITDDNCNNSFNDDYSDNCNDIKPRVLHLWTTTPLVPEPRRVKE